MLRKAIARACAVDPRSPALMHYRAQLGALLAATAGGRPEAYDLLRGVVHDVLERVAAARLDERRSEIVSDWITAFADLIELLVADRSPESAAEAFAVHESAKGRSFVAALAGGALPAPESVPEELRNRERRLNALERELQHPDGAADGGRFAHRLSRLDAVRTELEDRWTAIGRHAPDYAALRRGEPTTLERLRALLATAVSGPVALVSFFCGAHYTTVFVVRSDDPRLHALAASVGRDEVTAAVAAMRRAFNGAPEARGALRCVVALQRALRAEDALPFQVRIRIHNGDVERQGGELQGRVLVKAARIAALARGGEIIVSQVVREPAGLDESSDTSARVTPPTRRLCASCT